LCCAGSHKQHACDVGKGDGHYVTLERTTSREQLFTLPIRAVVA
jgi:hypothetical protein